MMAMRLRLLPEVRSSLLIDTTLGILEEVPGCDVGIDDIAERAEVSRSLVYRYFDGVDDILQHAQRRFFAPLCTELAQVLESQRDPLDQLHAIIAATVHFAAQHPSTFCHLVDGGLPRGTGSDPLIGPIERLTSAARPDPDAALVATATTALIESGIVTWLRADRTDTTAVTELLFTLAAPAFLRRRSTADDAQGHSVDGYRAPTGAQDPSGACPTPMSTQAQPPPASIAVDTTPMSTKEHP